MSTPGKAIISPTHDRNLEPDPPVTAAVTASRYEPEPITAPIAQNGPV